MSGARRHELVQERLRQMGEEDYARYVSELEQLDKRERKRHRAYVEHMADQGRDFTRDDTDYPLGPGFPLGRSLREDGESHRQAWMRILRADPCAYCGRAPAGTADHIEPQRGNRKPRGEGGAHTWLNLAGACEACNSSKGSELLLDFLMRRRGVILPKYVPYGQQPKSKRKVANSVAKQKRWAQVVAGGEGMKSQEARRQAA